MADDQFGRELDRPMLKRYSVRLSVCCLKTSFSRQIVSARMSLAHWLQFATPLWLASLADEAHQLRACQRAVFICIVIA